MRYLAQLSPTILLLGGNAVLVGILLYVAITLKIDLWRTKKAAKADRAALQQSCDALGQICRGLEERLSGMESTVKEAEMRAAVLVPPPSSRSGLNVNKRIQASRLSKRGERPEQIAAALGLPRNEVALLLKVQRLTMPN